MDTSVNEHIILPEVPGQIKYLETDLGWMASYPLRLDVGVYLAVVSGTATLNTGTDMYSLKPQTELTLTAGCLVQCTDRSCDFRVRLFLSHKNFLLKCRSR